MKPLGCFSVNQVTAMFPDMDISNLRRWTAKGYTVKLRQGWYALAEETASADFVRHVAERIYNPSYLSLHWALAFYGIIPEAVTELTNVTTLKTAHFSNPLGEFHYQTVKPALMWGYKPMTTTHHRTYMLAEPEKALLDLLYLYPQYDTEDALLQLRLDEDFMQTELNLPRLQQYTARFASEALKHRMTILKKTYGL